MPKEPVCIRRTNTVEEADVVVAWLLDRGIKAAVLDRDNPGVFAFGVTDVEGVAVYVADEETAKRAKVLLEQHDREREEAERRAVASTTLEVTCDECGTVNSFPPEEAGSVQQCAECNAFLDVPSPGGQAGAAE